MAKRHADIPKFPFLDQLDIDQNVKEKLSLNLARIYSGSEDIIETPIARSQGADKLISKWDKVFQENKSKLNDVLLKLEESQKSKFGPRSRAIPWSERKAGTLKYFEDQSKSYERQGATPKAPRDKGRLRPVSLSTAMKQIKNNTNSGLPFYTRKGLVKDRVLARYDELLSRKDPCVLFTRTQEQYKTRDVWGYPMVDSLREMTYYIPLLEYQRKLHWRSALNGPDAVNLSMTRILDEAIKRALAAVSVDFSLFDKLFKKMLQIRASGYTKYLFQPSCHSDIDNMYERKATIGLLTPDGVLSGDHSMPSGATFTNEDDSIGQYQAADDSGVIEDGLFDIQGDDGVYAVAPDKVKSLFNAFKRAGFEVNEEKSYIASNYLIYLQNLFHTDYRDNGIITGIYPVYRALNRICYQERWSNFEDYGISGKDYYSIRTISILENCKWHPLFKELVQFVLQHDKYNLEVSDEGLSSYIKMLKESSGTEGILMNQYGDNVKGLRNFATVKYLETLV